MNTKTGADHSRIDTISEIEFRLIKNFLLLLIAWLRNVNVIKKVQKPFCTNSLEIIRFFELENKLFSNLKNTYFEGYSWSFPLFQKFQEISLWNK